MHKGFIRSRIESRISGPRRPPPPSRDPPAGRSNSSESTITRSVPTYSQLSRMQSADGFLMVDETQEEGEGGIHSGRGVSDEETGHLTLEQQVEEPLSDMDGDLEDLVIPDEEEEGEEPRPKPAAAVEVVSVKPWLEGNKEVYEQQLELLQEHLTEAMLTNQSLKSENAELKSSHEELTRLRRENAILNRRLQNTSNAFTSSRASVEPVGVAGPKLEPAAKSSKESEGSFGGSVLTVSSSSDGFETVTMSPDQRLARRREQARAQNKSLWRSTMERLYEFVALFTEEQACPEDATPEKPLSAKKLKDNLQRLSRTSKPWQECGEVLRGILQWNNKAESLVVFTIYMYCVWNGWIISMVAFLAILMLTLTYLRTSGLAEQFGFQYSPPTAEQFDDLGLGDKLQLVKKVGQMCQNKSELVSDSLEKAQNLFLWHQPTATKTVYTNLCIFFIISILLPNSYVLTMIGLFIGVKLFIIDNIYRKYPKVKERYDSVARLWKSLPTDAQLYKRQSLTEEQLSINVPDIGAQSEDLPLTSRQRLENSAFCARFHLSLDELPLPSWRSGKRCSMMDRNRPLSLTRSGRLYLTHSHLCFERHSRPHRDPDRFVLSLMEVEGVVKAKPFAVLPGSGMSIEITLKNGAKYLFSAILNRDQAYRSVLDQGLILGLPWGTDIEGGGPEKAAKSSASPGDRSRSGSADELEGTAKEE